MTDSIQLVLTRYNDWDAEVTRDSYIDLLESQIEEMNEAVRNGEELFDDAVYDTCLDYLRELKPDSYLLHEVWSGDGEEPLQEDIDVHLIKTPMMSIQTVKHISDRVVKAFMDKLPPFGETVIFAPIKLNGHGIRVVWKDGYLVKANSRGRSTAGKNLLNQAVAILGSYCESFADLGVLEMRGEALLPFDHLDKAREFNPKIKSAFSGVSSMMRESASEEEWQLLHFVFYDVLCDSLTFESLSGKYEYIDQCGFRIPAYCKLKTTQRSLIRDIESAVVEMDSLTIDYPYYTDGVVFSIDEAELFEEFGAEDSFRYGNMALKIGRWRQDAYTGIVKRIEWKEGKTKKTPVAVLDPGVLTATGNTVTNVPLYAPLYIWLLEAYPGRPINFRYGGESGVLPTTPDGRLVKEMS